jgi:hypothetical protein
MPLSAGGTALTAESGRCNLQRITIEEHEYVRIGAAINPQ